MPRQARVIVPGFPHYIVQRGHNRQTVFVEPRDFEHYLANLQERKQVYPKNRSVPVFRLCDCGLTSENNGNGSGVLYETRPTPRQFSFQF